MSRVLSLRVMACGTVFQFKGTKDPQAAGSPFEYGARLTELALLGVLALRLGTRIDWDAERMEARGIPEAEPIINGRYRACWELSG